MFKKILFRALAELSRTFLAVFIARGTEAAERGIKQLEEKAHETGVETDDKDAN